MSQTPPPPPPVQPGAPVQPLSPADEKLWATLTHVGGIFFGFLPSLIVYLVLKDRGPFLAAHAKSALNFQLTMLIASVVAGILTIIIIGFILLPVIGIVIIVFSIIAAMKANAGEYYTYPLSIKFIK